MDNKPRPPITADRDDMIGRKRSDDRGDQTAPLGGGFSSVAGQTSVTQRIIIILSFLGLIAVGIFGWMKYQALLQKHEDLLGRFELLESRLSSTDESVTQSGAAMQITISKHNDELKKHWSEIRKLWGVSNDINKKKIANNKKDIAFLASKRESTEDTIGGLSKRIDKESSSVNDVAISQMALTEELEVMNQQLGKYVDQLNKLKKAHSKLNKSITENSDAISAMDSFRRNITQKIYQLERRPQITEPEIVVPIEVPDP
jgi:chromosome segregation ATPase